MTILAYVLHIGGGTIGLASGLAAAVAHKGGYLHRKAGIVFAVSMLVTATFAAYLAVAVPGQIVNLFIGTFAFYLVATAAKSRRDAVSISLQAIATKTGLSKSTVQTALRHLRRRKLLDPRVTATVTAPVRRILRPWVRAE
jgi:uncharacterized membrane protein YfcA